MSTGSETEKQFLNSFRFTFNFSHFTKIKAPIATKPFFKNKMSNRKKNQILFVYGYLIPFVERDFNILRKHFSVQRVECGLGMQKLNILNLLKIAKGVIHSNITFSWFAGIPSAITVAFAKLFGKYSIVVIGGAEVVSIPEIKYGFMRSPILRQITKFVLYNADLILPASDFLRKNTLQIVSPKHSKKVRLIYNGINHNQFFPNNRKEKIVITTAFLSKKNIVRKGLDTFIGCAKYLPEVNFVIAGKDLDGSLDRLKKQAPANVVFIENPSSEEILNWYRKAKVYCQLSRMETFGVALAEAMLCECIPVTTNFGALTEVTGDCGFFVPFKNIEMTVAAIKTALSLKTGAASRERIVNNFSLEKRELKIVELIRKEVVIS